MAKEDESNIFGIYWTHTKQRIKDTTWQILALFQETFLNENIIMADYTS